jgi:hypothetical protein
VPKPFFLNGKDAAYFIIKPFSILMKSMEDLTVKFEKAVEIVMKCLISLNYKD